MKHPNRFFLTVLLFCTFFIYGYATVITHDIGSQSLTIPGNSTDDYIITGTTRYNYIVVGFGYKGTITLKNCTFNFTSSGKNSPIRVTGKDNLSNTDPSRTNVNLVLEGDNVIYVDGEGRAGIQVDQGAQINISAIESCDNSSGTLTVTQANSYGGAGIGSLNHYNNSNETTSRAILSNGDNGITAGGNIIISSGTITSKGGHGAGLGGGYGTWYDGMIVIYGGVVNASTIRHAAGVGSGCPEGNGVESAYAPNSAIIALPPSKITSTGAGGTDYVSIPSLALAGTKVLVYIGDPNKPAIKVNTVDNLPDANIYVDLSQDPDINSVVSATVNPALLDINQVLFGKTNKSGMFSTTGQLQNNTTFFTDATSTGAATMGHPYLPTVTKLPNGGSVQLEMLQADFSIVSYPSVGLNVGYSSQEAVKNATCVKITYNDASPVTDLVFDLANGSASDFDSPVFLASDSATVISAPTSLNNGDVYYVLIPLKTGQSSKEYSDVLRIIGNWKGASTSYIRQIVSQVVANLRTEYICDGSSYTFNGEELTKEGVYTSVKTSTTGCKTESEVEVLNLIVNPRYNQNETLAIRENDLPYTWRDVVIPKGTTTQILTYQRNSVSGCDSTVHLNLTVYPNYNLKESLTICANELPYMWRDTILKTGTTSGPIVIRRKTIHGSDSIVTLNLTVHPSFNFNEELVICENELPYKWRDTTFAKGTTSKNVTFTRHTIHGCDSIVTLHLAVNPIIRQKESLFLCSKEFPYSWRDTTFENGTATGIFTFKRHSVLGCDSIVELSLTIRPSYDLKESLTICANELPYTWRDITLNKGTTSGKYVYQRQTIHGCDSVVTLNLTVHPSYAINEELIVCENELPYTWRDTIFGKGTVSKNLTFYRRSVYGCDSITNLSLTVYPSKIKTETVRTCHREQFYFRDRLIEDQGIYDDTLLTSNGCDSIIRLVYIIDPIYAFTKEDTLYEGGVYHWRGRTLTVPGVYYDTLHTQSECDSVFKLTLVSSIGYLFADTVELCNQDEYHWRGNTYTESGLYKDPYKSSMGTDSVYTLLLTLHKNILTHRQIICCPGETFILRGKEHKISEVFYDTIPSFFGCDSICEYVVTQARDFYKKVELCRKTEEAYHYLGKDYPVPGHYVIEGRTVDGCDSIHELDLRVEKNTVMQDTITMCHTELPFTFNGKTYTEPGLYHDKTVEEGCGTTTTNYVIRIGNSYHFTTNATCCAFETYAFQGQTFSTSGTHQISYTSQCGCDSIYQLNLTYQTPIYRTRRDSICQGEQYSFHTKSYTMAGTYTDSTCYKDSSVVEKLYLSVIQPPHITRLNSGPSCSDVQSLDIEFEYKGEKPDYCYVYLDREAQKSGFASFYYLPVDGNLVTLPQPSALKPQTYSFHLTPHFASCDTLPGMSGTFYIRYPSSVIEQNWDDVVAALNYENNGGYHFAYYRWEVNGVPVIGQNSPILYLPNQLHPGDEVVCYLTRTGEQEAIPTCPLTIRTYNDVHAHPIYVSPTIVPRIAPRTRMAISQKATYRLYDSSGRIIGGNTLTKGEWDINLPASNGLYLLTVLPAESKPVTYKIVVK